MKPIVGDFSTNVRMTGDEAKEVCGLGKGAECCAFLAVDGGGFNCIRMDYPTNSSVFDRLERGEMAAKGRGGWEGCFWAGQIYNHQITRGLARGKRGKPGRRRDDGIRRN